MIEFLFLDLDDTILDFKKAERMSLEKTIRSFGIEPTDENCDRKHCTNNRDEELKLHRMIIQIAPFLSVFI